MRVDISRLIGLTNHKLLDAAIDDILRDAEDDPVFFSDLLVSWEQTGPLVDVLMKELEDKYVLLVLCDEWGQQVKPGDKVSRKFKNPLVVNAVPIPTSTLKAWKNQGIYDKKRFRYKYYPVDDKGCITVCGADAEYFLRLWGVHSISGKRISAYLKPTSQVEDTNQGKAKDPKDGVKKFVHYHRYKEMTKEMYEALPVLTKQDKGSTK